MTTATTRGGRGPAPLRTLAGVALAVLAACEGGKTKAAALLGINRTTLWKKLNQYGLE